MNRHDRPIAPTSEEDPVLADLIEELTGRLQSGGDGDALILEHPEYAEQLRELLPALQALAQAGQAPARAGTTALFAGEPGALTPGEDDLILRGLTPPTRPSDGPPGSLDQPAVTLGDFRLVREVGRGGMGIVYEAEQLSLARRVALKILPFASTLHPRQVQRFKNEAMAAAGLHHAHIVPVYAVGCDHGVHFYAMQLLDGCTLTALIADRRQERDSAASSMASKGQLGRIGSVRQAAELILQAAEALEYAHQGGVIHRDVKPANLMLDGRGWLWVTDFGLACCQGQAGLTGTGEQPGTLRYMSPEQVLGSRDVVDYRTDVYALGATLYELLALEPAWSGDTRQELLGQIASGEPKPPRSLDRSIPVDLETIVLKAMARNPGDRYATAQEFADDLRRFLDDRPILAHRPFLLERGKRWLRRHRSVVYAATAIAVVAVAALAVSTVLIARQRDRAEEHARETRQVVDRMYTDVAEMWLARQAHLEPLQLDYLQRALAFYEKEMSQTSRDPDLCLATGQAGRRVGDIRQKLGDDGLAEEAYTRAEQLLQELIAHHPGRADARAERALVLTHRGNLLRQHGRLAQAREAYQEARDVFAELVSREPDEPSHRRGLAGSYTNLGLVEHNLGRTREAEEALRTAQPMLRRLVAEDARQPTYRHDLAGLCYNFGALMNHLKRLKEAERSYHAAHTLWKQLAHDWPAFTPARQAEAACLDSLAGLRMALGRPREAEQAYLEALRQRSRLTERCPNVAAYRQELAASHAAFGQLLAATGRTGQAAEAYRNAVALMDRLVKDHPSVSAFHDDLRRLKAEAAALPGTGAAYSPGKQERSKP
jgi:tetratricopeptide (TPR) repeat protein